MDDGIGFEQLLLLRLSLRITYSYVNNFEILPHGSIVNVVWFFSSPEILDGTSKSVGIARRFPSTMAAISADETADAQFTSKPRVPLASAGAGEPLAPKL